MTDHLKSHCYGSEVSSVVAVSDLEEAIYVSFRGTDSTMELITEILHMGGEKICDDCPIKDVQITSFFNQAFIHLDNMTRTAIIKQHAAHPNYDLYFTGHSLGGSLASVLAFYMVYNGDLTKAPILITMGM